MADKLARLLWHLLKYKEPFNPEVYVKEEEKLKQQKLQRPENMAESLMHWRGRECQATRLVS